MLRFLDNNLPSTVIRFGSSDNNDIVFSCHLDSCAAMNTGNSLLHMWIMTTYPEIIASYERYDDDEPFQHITLDCAVPSSAVENDTSNFFAVVTYKTRYTDVNGDMMLLSFGLGEAISVNAIIGLPTLRSWKMILDVGENKATSKTLNRYFELSYQHADTGLPSSISFSKNDVIRPHRPNKIDNSTASHLTTTTTKPIVLTSVENGVVFKLTQDGKIDSITNKPASE